MRRSTIVEIISALFILMFLYTAISKTQNINYTIGTLRSANIFKDYSLAKAIAWAVVIAEYTVSVLLFFPGTRKLGLYSSLGLMTLFSLYIIYMKLFDSG